jgi:molecular chaperone DnaK (HSP70)
LKKVMPQYIVGIDLGTTNSALAYASAAHPDEESSEVNLLPIPQLVNPGEVAPLDLLASSLYIPGPKEFVEGALALPWDPHPQYIAGQLARARGVENPGRSVTSAKSWLSNQNADPAQPLLPLNAPEGVQKVSPVEASRQYLLHLRSAWEQAHPEAKLAEQNVLLTVPASFDAAARELTQRAAHSAGFANVTIIEEPQAAFYAWIERNQNWREQVEPGNLILVVDIGGGTTDLTLIAVTEQNGELRLERVAVGEHLLLGGDNMDLAVSRHAEQQFSERGTKLDAIQFHALWQQCRTAKEVLLSNGDSAPDEHPVTILGRGTGLIGGTLRGKVAREDVRRLLLDGFFPVVDANAAPQRQRRAALMEVGLNYATDPAITKHIAQFLRQAGGAHPTHLLLNGGVLQSHAIEQRIFEVINGWLAAAGAPPLIELQNETKQTDLMHAVARGAAYYGLARTGKGVRIRGGVPRTYYVGVESSLPAIPGMPAPMKALTVVPFGLEEGSKVELPQRKFALVVGEPAEFRFFSSLSRKDDAPGELVDEIGDDIEELAPIEVLLPSHDGEGRGEQVVPVTLESDVTETGMLELWCVAADGRRWKLEFNVRERSAA